MAMASVRLIRKKIAKRNVISAKAAPKSFDDEAPSIPAPRSSLHIPLDGIVIEVAHFECAKAVNALRYRKADSSP